MTKDQLSQAVVIARSDADLSIEDLSIFDGFGLPDFQPITCTVEALAMLVRWQGFCFDGSIDQENLNEIATIGRHRFQVVGKAVA